MSTKVLALTGGHTYDADAFRGLLDHFTEHEVTWLEQPDGDAAIRSGDAATYAALLCYDMPGIGVRIGSPITTQEPDEELKDGWRRLLDAGTGIVFLHHSLAGWPAWPEHSELMGGIFLYEPRAVRGEHQPDSGYIHHVPVDLAVVRDHPVTSGLPATFRLADDEPYLCPVFEDSIEVLVRRSGYDDPRGYLASEHIVLTGKERHCTATSPLASDAAVWVREEGHSRIVYVQPGDNGSTFQDRNFVQLARNAVAWVAEPRIAAAAAPDIDEQAG